MTVQHIVCFDEGFYLLDYNSFTYSESSDFVEYLRSIQTQRIWFNQSEGLWNSVERLNIAETLTRNGIGFSFNMMESDDLLNFNEASNDFRYSYNVEKANTKQPKSTGSQPGNKLFMKFKDIDFETWKYSKCRQEAFSVHSPFELPITSNFNKFHFSIDFQIWITPEIIQTDDDLRSFDPDERNCYFEGERKLNYFKVYTQRNCESECLSFAGEI
jgi:acid-sensing ion channel, other